MSRYTKEEQAEHRRKWVEALRSGEYEQGQGALPQERNGTFEYSCLGVACEISGLGEFVPRSNPQSNAFNFVVDGDQSQHVVMPDMVQYWLGLPDDVQDWLGLSDRHGWYDNHTGSLVNSNDFGASFNVIADIIESEPEGLIG